MFAQRPLTVINNDLGKDKDRTGAAFEVLMSFVALSRDSLFGSKGLVINPNSKAFHEGLQVNDVIVSINGRSSQGLNHGEVQSLIKGSNTGSLTLQLERLEILVVCGNHPVRASGHKVARPHLISLRLWKSFYARCARLTLGGVTPRTMAAGWTH
ncbi:hypothetical protein RRG08_061017 [Elysia crispata]|uniref:PDZ domain-containing protein n=1 Tax=Elysia crispata TaxID=231223 RepID=A0AAE1AUV8_9GAST|nr:hypothetical protein RRG08_061017 [Elysia crispata]